MTQVLVRSALESRLGTWAAARVPALTVVWENAPPVSALPGTYLRAFVLPADTQSQTLDGLHRARIGVFQVSIVTPINVGPGAAAGIADELNTLFPCFGRYTVSTVTTQIIEPVSIGPAIQDGDSYMLPVSIRYRSDTI